ncbi:MAG: minor capsid protein, partial [Planctomycetota bacterium]
RRGGRLALASAALAAAAAGVWLALGAGGGAGDDAGAVDAPPAPAIATGPTAPAPTNVRVDGPLTVDLGGEVELTARAEAAAGAALRYAWTIPAAFAVPRGPIDAATLRLEVRNGLPGIEVPVEVAVRAGDSKAVVGAHAVRIADAPPGQALRGAKDPNRITQRLGLEQRAALIARSELANAYVQGSLARARERGDTYVRVLAATDERMCPICAARNGRIYPVDRVPLPWHPRCRCVAVGVSDEAVQERDPETRRLLLDSERGQGEHQDGVEAYADGQHRKQLQGLQSQRARLKDPELIEAMDERIRRLEDRGPDLAKARADLARALRTPTASEKRLFPGRAESLQE